MRYHADIFPKRPGRLPAWTDVRPSPSGSPLQFLNDRYIFKRLSIMVVIALVLVALGLGLISLGLLFMPIIIAVRPSLHLHVCFLVRSWN